MQTVTIYGADRGKEAGMRAKEEARAESFRAALLRACEAAEIAAGMVPPESGDSGILRAAIGEGQGKLGRAYALFTGERWKEPNGGGVSAGSASDAAGTVAPGGYGAELERKEVATCRR